MNQHTHEHPRAAADRTGFTLIELLVVVTIIVILLSLIVPAADRAMETARDVVCKTNLKTLSSAFHGFGLDHRNRLPGNFYTHYDASVAWQWSWIGGEIWPAVAGKPGTIIPYMGGVRPKLYRCASLEEGIPGSGVGSNGKFDYASILAINGAKKTKLPRTFEWQDLGTGEWATASLPIILEESPAENINGTAQEPGFSAADRMATTHGWSNYAAPDHSIAIIHPTTNRGPSALNEMRATTPSGVSTSLTHVDAGGDGYHFGDWDKR